MRSNALPTFGFVLPKLLESLLAELSDKLVSLESFELSSASLSTDRMATRKDFFLASAFERLKLDFSFGRGGGRWW